MQQRYRRKAVSSIVRRKRFSPFMLIGLSVPVVLTLIVSTVFILPRLGSRALEGTQRSPRHLGLDQQSRPENGRRDRGAYQRGSRTTADPCAPLI